MKIKNGKHKWIQYWIQNGISALDFLRWVFKHRIQFLEKSAEYFLGNQFWNSILFFRVVNSELELGIETNS